MKTHTLKALAKHRSVEKGVLIDSSAPAQDPLGFLFERHRHNPFVRFLRAAFFYDAAEQEHMTRDRVPSQRPYAHFHGSLKF